MTIETVSIAHGMETKQETSLVLQHYLISVQTKDETFPSVSIAIYWSSLESSCNDIIQTGAVVMQSTYC